MARTTLHDIITEARDRAGSANALARKLELAPPSVLYWLWGSTLPSADKLEALAVLSNRSLEEVQKAWIRAHEDRMRRTIGRMGRISSRPFRGGSDAPDDHPDVAA